MVADAALSRGWQLYTVLPFGRDDYARDFDDAGAAALSERLQASANVLELSGSRNEPGGEAAAYERGGRVSHLKKGERCFRCTARARLASPATAAMMAPLPMNAT